MNLIANNPYRLLGVYANSPTKERVANVNKGKAFLRVGKSVTFPLDLPLYLPTVNRTAETMAQADADLTLPKDQVKFAQFWFINETPLDKVAFNHLVAGNIDNAIGIWEKKDCASSLQNRMVCALIQARYKDAVGLAERLYSQYEKEFVAAIIGSSQTNDSLAFDFLDALCNEVGVSKILPCISNASWKQHVGAQAVQPLLDQLQSAIATAKAVDRKKPSFRLAAGKKLMQEGKPLLKQLGKFLKKTDLQYQMVADKFGLEVLQCGIDYFNGSEESDAAFKAKELQDYALLVVVGQMAKDRCKENVDILNGIIASLPPKEVFAEDKAIHEELRKYCQLPDKICHAVTLLNNTKPHLQAIKRKLGANNAYYLKLSTQVVGNALSNVIEEVNSVQSDPSISLHLQLGMSLGYSELNKLKTVFRAAWDATKLMDSFDMEFTYKSEHYNKNRSILKDMCNSFGIPTSSSSSSSTSSSTRTTSSSSSRANTTTSRTTTRPTVNRTTSTSSDDNSGCWIAVGIIIFIIFCISTCC